jgi:RsmE family RNA methyltransferase
VNLILFELPEVGAPLARTDRRAVHILDVLHRQIGDEFDAGLVNGPRGKGVVQAVAATTLSLSFRWEVTPPPLDAITVIIGLPRPQTARDLLRELTSIGVQRLHFVAAEKSEPSYASSTLWSSGESRRLLVAGAEQAFDTRLPDVTHGRKLDDVLAELGSDGTRVALDNYEATRPLAKVHAAAAEPLVLAVGSERGWSNREREQLRQHGFELARLGTRVLRVETAAIAALAILKAQRA